MMRDDTSGMMGNATGMTNATLATSGTMNATLAYAQEDGMVEMEEGMMMTTLPVKSIRRNENEIEWDHRCTMPPLAEAFKSKVTADIIGCNTMQPKTNVGANSVRQGSRVNSCTWIFSIQDRGSR